MRKLYTILFLVLILVSISGCASESSTDIVDGNVVDQEIGDLNDELGGLLEDLDDTELGTEFESV